ncbi:MAG: hypothetical protein LBS03_10050 [Bacteroidales bacterium]|jgi:hypothetical protein|nr:hypothetical protein [Bacteroidales bacterium]
MKDIVRNIVNLLIMLVMVQMFFSCRGQDEIYREYVTEGGIVYPGKPVAVAKNRIGAVEIVWPNNDVTITEARIWWNNYADSVVVPVTADMDTVRKRIEMPVEGVYSFFIRTYDRYGNVSIVVEVIGRSIGDKYMENFFNRMTTGYKTSGGNNLQIEWDVADTEAGAVYCNLFYTAANGTEKTIRVPAAETATVLDDWKPGTSLRYNTVYKPDPENPIEIATSFREQKGVYVLVDNKSPSRVISFSSQSGGPTAGNAYDGVIDHNRWLSDNTGYPHYIVIDLGEEFNIARFDIWSSNYDGGLDNRMPTRVKWEVSNANPPGGGGNEYLGGNNSGQRQLGTSCGMKFTAAQDFVSFTVRFVTWTTTTSGLTLSLYEWKGSWASSVAEQPVVSKVFTNVGDYAYLTVSGDANFPAGDYLWVADTHVGTIGPQTGSAVAGNLAFWNGVSQDESYYSYVSYASVDNIPWTSLGEYDYDYTLYPYRYSDILPTAGRLFKLTSLNSDPIGSGVMCLAEIDVYIKLAD